MFQLHKILKLLFVILILVVLAEAGYYIYFLYSSQKISTPSGTPTETTLISISSILPSPPDQTTALNQQVLYSLMRAKKGVLSSSVLTNQFQGKIIELDILGGLTQKTNYKYKLKLKLKGEQDFTNELFYNEAEMKKAVIVKRVNDEEVPATIATFKLHDKIIIDEKVDLTKDFVNNIIELKITIM